MRLQPVGNTSFPEKGWISLISMQLICLWWLIDASDNMRLNQYPMTFCLKDSGSSWMRILRKLKNGFQTFSSFPHHFYPFWWTAALRMPGTSPKGISITIMESLQPEYQRLPIHWLLSKTLCSTVKKWRWNKWSQLLMLILQDMRFFSLTWKIMSINLGMTIRKPTR